MIGIHITITMERTLYLDLPEDMSEEDILKNANKEIILPNNAMSMANTALRNLHINIPKIDLEDWNSTNVKYEVVK